MRGIIGVIVACIALVCGFYFYGESAGHKNSDPSWGNTEEEQHLADSDYDEEGTYDEETSYSEEEEDTDDGMSLNDILLPILTMMTGLTTNTSGPCANTWMTSM